MEESTHVELCRDEKATTQAESQDTLSDEDNVNNADRDTNYNDRPRLGNLVR